MPYQNDHETYFQSNVAAAGKHHMTSKSVNIDRAAASPRTTLLVMRLVHRIDSHLLSGWSDDIDRIANR